MLFQVILRVSKRGHPIQANNASTRWISTMATAAVAQNMLPTVMNKDGSFVRSFGRESLRFPEQIAVDARDNIYVCCFEKLVVFSAEGVLLHNISTYCNSNSIAISQRGMVAISDKNTGCIKLFSCE